jgi:hypothetical protein
MQRTCKLCGNPIGHSASVCDHCVSKQRQEREARIAYLESELKRLEQARRQTEKSVVERTLQALQARLAEGQQAFIYDSLYLPVDYEVDGIRLASGFEIDPLKRLGLWDGKLFRQFHEQ